MMHRAIPVLTSSSCSSREAESLKSDILEKVLRFNLLLALKGW